VSRPRMKASTSSARAGSGKKTSPGPRRSVPSAQSCSMTLTTRPSYCLPCHRYPSSGGCSEARICRTCDTSSSYVLGGA
jgi:hypothetical protein